ASVVSIVGTKNGSHTAGATTGRGIFTVTRTGGDLTHDMVVHYTIDAGSTAVAGDDYAALTGTVTILAGQKSAAIDVLIGQPSFVVPTKTLVLDLSTDTFYHLGTSKVSAQILILGN
ncbi:MAG: hypothetical protein NT031_14985, partial [Planctomycetota bacterium]|nr:hypothetical protein [Planctomycetota bacterium]